MKVRSCLLAGYPLKDRNNWKTYKRLFSFDEYERNTGIVCTTYIMPHCPLRIDKRRQNKTRHNPSRFAENKKSIGKQLRNCGSCWKKGMYEKI